MSGLPSDGGVNEVFLPGSVIGDLVGELDGGVEPDGLRAEESGQGKEPSGGNVGQVTVAEFVTDAAGVFAEVLEAENIYDL